MTNSDYSPNEIMIASSSRALSGERVVFVGVGLPNIACNLARHTVSPELELVYESGVFGAQPSRLPLSIGDPTLVSGSTATYGMSDLFMYFLQGGLIETAFLGAAQIDRYGNLNSTVIGAYNSPKVRLPGSGGACEIAIHAQKVFIIMPLNKRAFVNKLDYITSPGHIKNRKELGITSSGPQMVITNKAIFDFNGPNGEMRLISIHPGNTLEEIQAEISWKILLSEEITKTIPPSLNELKIIREKLDLNGIYTSK